MVVCVVGADVKCGRKLSIALKAKTFVVTWQRLAFKDWVCLGSIALDFLLDVLTFAGNYDLGWTWLILFTRVRSMARIETGMSTSDGSLCLTTGVWTMSQFCVFAFSWAVAALLAGMNATL